MLDKFCRACYNLVDEVGKLLFCEKIQDTEKFAILCFFNQSTLAWGITENVFGPSIIPFYFMFVYVRLLI